MVSAIQRIFEHKELPISQRLGSYFLFAQGRQTKIVFIKLATYYPFKCFLNKILSSCIVYFENLISETQSGFMKGRCIGENTRYMI